MGIYRTYRTADGDSGAYTAPKSTAPVSKPVVGSLGDVSGPKYDALGRLVPQSDYIPLPEPPAPVPAPDVEAAVPAPVVVAPVVVAPVVVAPVAVESFKEITVESFPHPAHAMEPGAKVASPVSRYVTELLGTFFLVLVGMHVQPFTTCLMLAALTFMCAGISQGHMNPAVTVAHLVRQTITPVDAAWYGLAQLVGATLAAVLSIGLLGASPSVSPYETSLTLESLVYFGALMAPTFVLCLVHLAMLAGESRTQFFGLAIGFATLACIVAYGAGHQLFNPAASIGNYLAEMFGKGSAVTHLALIVSQCAAGALAGLAFRFCAAKDIAAVLLTEFLGTFAFVFLLTATNGAPATTVAQTVGLGYVALVYFSAEVSEAHFNPTITLAHLLAGDSKFDSLTMLDVGGYIVVQLIASVLAALAGGAVFGVMPPAVDEVSSVIVFSIFAASFILAFVHLNNLGDQEGNGHFGLAIGFAVLANFLLFSTHANPVAAVGLLVANAALSGGFATSALAVAAIIVVPFVGTLLAVLAFKFRLTLSSTNYGYASLATEAIGTGFLVLALFAMSEGMSANPSFDTSSDSFGTGTGSVGLDLGLLYAAVTYTGGYVSGAHFNPAVTLAHLLQGSPAGGFTLSSSMMPTRLAGLYMLTQTLASVACALLGAWLYHGVVPSLHEDVSARWLAGLMIFSFALALVHLSVTAAQLGNGFYGVAIGFVLYAGVLSFGVIETALFNPAIAIGVYFAHGSVGSGLNLTLLILTPLLGGVLAKLVFLLMLDRTNKVAKLTTEFIGTFLLLLSLVTAPGSVGIVYVSFTYMGGYTSGAHFNPAVTGTRFFLGDLSATEALQYVGAQMGGALLAAIVGFVEGVKVGSFLSPVPSPYWVGMSRIVACEALFTFVVCLVHCQVISGNKVGFGKSGNGYFGLAMGFSYRGAYQAVAAVDAGLFNPAAAIAFWLVDALANARLPPIDILAAYLLLPALAAYLAERAFTAYRTHLVTVPPELSA